MLVARRSAWCSRSASSPSALRFLLRALLTLSGHFVGRPRRGPQGRARRARPTGRPTRREARDGRARRPRRRRCSRCSARRSSPSWAARASCSGSLHDNPTQRHLRFIAPNVLDERFAGSPILVTIPLFTFVGYLMAESKTPDRIVRASRAFFGWMPGGLAIVCIVASAFFTTLTGGSGVTIVAIGGLLYPALRKQGYPDDFSLGLVTTGGSLGLLLPPSLPILVYALVAGIDFNAAFKAGLIPGVLIMVLLGVHAAYIGHASTRSRARSRACARWAAALWLLKWELGVPVVILGGLGTGLTVARRERGAHRRLHARRRGLHPQGSRAQEGPAARRQGVDGARGRHHPHPGDGERAHQLRRRSAHPGARPRLHARPRPHARPGSS